MLVFFEFSFDNIIRGVAGAIIAHPAFGSGCGSVLVAPFMA
jgi:hypothetical protein